MRSRRSAASSAARPASVTGGTRGARPERGVRPRRLTTASGFEYVPSPVLARLQGEWSATRLVRDGAELPKMMVQTGRRVASQNEIRITFGGQLIIHARVRIDASAQPVHVDYFNVGGQAKGAVQHGIMQWVGDEVCFCMAAPNQPRPTDFTCPAGSGRTLSQWRPAKKSLSARPSG